MLLNLSIYFSVSTEIMFSLLLSIDMTGFLMLNYPSNLGENSTCLYVFPIHY